MRALTLVHWRVVKAQGLKTDRPYLSPGQWAFAAFHLDHDQAEEVALRRALFKEEAVLHALLRTNAEAAGRMIKDEPVDAKAPAEDKEMMRLAGDPYFGTIMPPMPVPFAGDGPPPFGEMAPDLPAIPFPDFGQRPIAHDQQPMANGQSPMTFPVFPIAAG